MKRLLMMGLILLLALTGCSRQADQPEAEQAKPATLDEMKARATVYVEDLLQGNYEAAYTDHAHDQVMKEAVSARAYKQIMEDLYEQVGQPVAVLDTADWMAQGYQIVQVAVAFEEKNFGLNVVFNEFGEIAGLNYSEVVKTQAEDLQAEHEAVTEPLAVGPYQLEGELMIPTDPELESTPLPVVILVHGSGASDKDETIGPNQPFLDLAQGLAGQGIASIRYDKRAFAHSEAFVDQYDFTVWEEAIEDALAAVALAKADPRIDNNRIYILGHSLGGYLIPRMMKHTNEVAGWIFMAASNQAVQDMIVDQYQYLSNLDGEISEEEQAAIDQVAAIAEQLKEPESLDAEIPILGAYPAYWIDLKDYKPLEEVMLYTTPKLFLQGNRDYQVPVDQFEAWKETIGTANAEFYLFQGLNHLMMSGEGDPNPGEYQLPNHVDQQVIETIGEFIQR